MSVNVEVHPTSIVEDGAVIGDNVKIGPFCCVGKHVKLGDGCILRSNVILEGHLSVDTENEFFPFTSIGAPPQDLSYKGDPTRVIIGKKNIFREFVSVHRGTLKQNHETLIGNECMFMAYSHVGHDADVGNKVIVVNDVNLAGHVKVGDGSIIGGGSNIAQFVSLGRGSYIGGASAVDRDVPPFCTGYGNRIRMKGINIIGMRRQGHSKMIISELIEFYKTMESSGLSPRSFIEHPEYMAEFAQNHVIEEMVAFIRESEVGIAPFLN